jgi:threonine/homoserine/homoserine lactone efflux protein
MMLNLFLKGCFIGFSIAMPVGPIGLLCIRNALTHGLRFGLISGLGAAVADAIFGIVAGLGITTISVFMASFQIYLQLLGALFLSYLGIITFRENPRQSNSPDIKNGLNYAFTSTFFLTLINPMTILSFVGIYVGLASDFPTHSWLFPIMMTLGIFIGSALWWLLLSSGASCFKSKINLKTRKWLNRISGLMILGFSSLIFITILTSG